MRIGSMLTSTDETVDLGTHGGRVVRGVVRRRVLRLGLGERPRLALTQLRPVAVEVDGARTDIVRVDVQSRVMLQRALLALVASIVVPRVIARVRRRRGAA